MTKEHPKVMALGCSRADGGNKTVTEDHWAGVMLVCAGFELLKGFDPIFEKYG